MIHTVDGDIENDIIVGTVIADQALSAVWLALQFVSQYNITTTVKYVDGSSVVELDFSGAVDKGYCTWICVTSKSKCRCVVRKVKL